MKLCRENARRQRAIRDALASGSPLGGLLVGLTAVAMTTGCFRPTVAGGISEYVPPEPPPGRAPESGAPPTAGAPSLPDLPAESDPTPNAANETTGQTFVRGEPEGIVMGTPPATANE